MRVGVISPNLVLNIGDWNRMSEDPTCEWSFDLLAKKAALLFDKIYLTENLELTCEIIENCGELDDSAQVGLLRFLASQGVLFQPKDLGYSSCDEFLQSNIRGEVTRIHQKLRQVGNPSNNCEPGDSTYVGQPDIGDSEAHDGCHPRSDRLFGAGDPVIAKKSNDYESLLVQRNAALLRQAGMRDVAIISEVAVEHCVSKQPHPVWRVLVKEMPEMDQRAPWNDVLDFRDEIHTQQYIRNLRRWARKVTTEEWTDHELEDEIRSLVFEYEKHLRGNRLLGGNTELTFVISGLAELGDIVVNRRISRLGRLVAMTLENQWGMPETGVPGYELALFPEIERVF